MAYKVPFVDYPRHNRHLMKGLMPVIRDVVFNRADFILRGDLKQFEKTFAQFLGVRHAVGLNSGTDALFLSLYAAGIGRGDEVITVAHTFVATIAAVVRCGAKPVLVDIKEDFNMNVDLIEKAITSRTRAVLPVHLNGRVCDMAKLMGIARKHRLMVVEDAAQALGATFNGQKAGTFGFSSCFSLYPAKLLGGIGDGGVLATNSDRMAQHVRYLRDHGQKRETGDVLFYGFNTRLDNLNAAVIHAKMRYLPEWIKRRREIAGRCQKGLAGIPGLALPHFEGNRKYFDIYQNYVVRARKRDELVDFLSRKGVETLVSWRKPVHKHKGLKLSHFKLPVTEQISKEVVSLPMNTELTNQQVAYVIKCVHEFYQKN